MFLEDDLPNPLFVRGVRIAMDQHDGDRGDRFGRDCPRRDADIVLVERFDLAAEMVDASRNFPDQARWNRTLRLDPLEQTAVARNVLASDLQHGPETGTHDHRRARTFA